MITHTKPEWHPLRQLFTVMAIFGGLLVVIFIDALSSGPLRSHDLLLRPDDLLWALGLPLLQILGASIIAASIHTLKATDSFRNWNTGISRRDKDIATFASGMGLCASVALCMFAIMVAEW